MCLVFLRTALVTPPTLFNNLCSALTGTAKFKFCPFPRVVGRYMPITSTYSWMTAPPLLPLEIAAVNCIMLSGLLGVPSGSMLLILPSLNVPCFPAGDYRLCRSGSPFRTASLIPKLKWYSTKRLSRSFGTW